MGSSTKSGFVFKVYQQNCSELFHERLYNCVSRYIYIILNENGPIIT